MSVNPRQRELEIILEATLLFDEGKTPIRKLAEQIREREADLVQELGEEWIIDRLVWMLYRKQQRVQRANQLPLPGFENLPRRMTLPDGTHPPLAQATITDLKKYRTQLARKRDSRLANVDRLIALMASYVGRLPHISVIEVMLAEKDRIERHGEASA